MPDSINPNRPYSFYTIGIYEGSFMADREIITYIRVSTSQQGRSGLGIEAQRSALHHFAQAEGFEVVREFVEVETGEGADAIDRRPQLKAISSRKETTVSRRRSEAGSSQPQRPFHQRAHGTQGALPGRGVGAGR